MDPAAPGLIDRVSQRVFERDHVAGVDGELAGNVYWRNLSEGVNHQRADALYRQE